MLITGMIQLPGMPDRGLLPEETSGPVEVAVVHERIRRT